MVQGPPLVVPNAAQITLRSVNGAAALVNVLGAQIQGATAINQALANTLDTAIKSAWTTRLATHCHTTVQLVSVGIRDIRTPNMAEYIGVGAPAAGSGTGDVLPKGVALVVTLRTARAGQSFRGRVYIGGFTEAANDASGGVLAAVSTAAVAFITDIQGILTTNGLALAVVSRPAFAQKLERTVTHADGSQTVITTQSDARVGQITPVTAVLARNAVWDSQRRRTSAGSASTLFAPPVAMSTFEDGELVTAKKR